MSSPAVRTLILNFLDANSDETVIDLTGVFDELRDLLKDALGDDAQPGSPWLGLQFVGNEELPISLVATNDKGLYRETGSVLLHVCAEAAIGAGQSIITRAELLRNIFRGVRIGSILVESVTPVNLGQGATLQFEGGYISGTVTVSYRYDNNLGA